MISVNDYEIIPNLLREKNARSRVNMIKLSEWIEGIPKIVG